MVRAMPKEEHDALKVGDTVNWLGQVKRVVSISANGDWCWVEGVVHSIPLRPGLHGGSVASPIAKDFDAHEVDVPEEEAGNWWRDKPADDDLTAHRRNALREVLITTELPRPEDILPARPRTYPDPPREPSMEKLRMELNASRRESLGYASEVKFLNDRCDEMLRRQRDTAPALKWMLLALAVANLVGIGMGMIVASMVARP